MDSPKFFDFSNFAHNTNSVDQFFNLPMKDIDIGRESIPILDLSNSFGRESLGILKVDCDFNTSLNIESQPRLSYNSEISPQNLLNQAFVLSRKTLDFKSTSTVYSVNSSKFSFNNRDFDQPSSIRNFDSLSYQQIQDSNNHLNEAFLYNFNESPLSSCRARYLSLPVYPTKNVINGLVQQNITNRYSEGFIEIVNENECLDKNETFNDSVFMEARYLTEKFSEGSNDGFTLDETDPPELVEEKIKEKEYSHKCGREEVFKKIDKLLPVNSHQKHNDKLDREDLSHNLITNIENEKETLIKEEIVTNKNDKKEVEIHAMKENLIEQSKNRNSDSYNGELKHHEEKESQVNLLKQVSEDHKSFEVEKSREILHTLSQILCNENRTDKDTEIGQKLLHSLSDILSNKGKSKSFINNTTKTGDSVQLNNSTSLKINKDDSMIKRRSTSFSFPTKKIVKSKLTNIDLMKSSCSDVSKNKTSCSGTSEISVEMKNISTESTSSLKMRKNVSGPKRGPMKAIIPVENFTKNQQKSTPPKCESKLLKFSSKISTPVREVRIKPMAQSTPDNCPSLKRNLKSFSSPNFDSKFMNTSGSTVSLSSSKDLSIKDQSSLLMLKSHLPRRNSISEFRKTPNTSDTKKSTSVKESSLMKTMNKIRQNITSSPGLQSKGIFRDCSNLSNSSANSGKNNETPRKMMASFGKENTSAVL